MDPIICTFSDTNLPLTTVELSALPKPFPLILDLLYGGTAFIAFVTNILAIIFLVKNKKISVGLRKYLMNLAVTDLTMAVFSVPFNYTGLLHGYWRFPLFLCPLSQFINICTLCVSIFTFTAIGIERYLNFIYLFFLLILI
jgi:hypothetical protein